ncbi:MAG: SusC/RagA family TonB-linked outer membrane protein [Saprospiraceae bacterium]|nr:MAG: SusC/RagA family TonB-linked outer membrane protein [Saprospiraceae bacterium]
MKLTYFFSFLGMLLLAIPNLHAQTSMIGGRVTSADGTPLAGVNIVLQETGNGTVTDEDGYYQIAVPGADTGGNFFFRKSPEYPTLIFSYTGFNPAEVKVGNETQVDIVMQSEFTELEEIIVTGTAAGQYSKLMSFAVGNLEQKLISTVPGENPGIGLQGKISGLRVHQTGGQPGQGVYFQIRSANAIANGQQPLLIVDGLYLNGTSLADFHTEDIDHIEVLKGSAGASLYGSQAANGVIQIFTKRGQDLETGTTRVTYRSEVGFSQEINRYPLNTKTNREIIDPTGPQPVLGNPSESGLLDTELPNLQDYQENYLFQNGSIQSHYLGVQGKSNKTNFLASAQRFRDKGIIQHSEGYTRHAFRLNVDHEISQKFQLKSSAHYSSAHQDLLAPSSNGPGSYLASMLFLTPIFDLDAVNEEDGTANDWDIDNTGMGISNPLYDRAHTRQTVDRNRLLGSFQVNYYPNLWLSLSYQAGIDRSNHAFEQFVEKGFLSTNVPGLFGPLATAGVQNSGGGGIHRSDRTDQFFTSRVSAIAERQFGNIATAFQASFLYEDLTRQLNESRGENLAVAGIRSLDNARSNIFISSEMQEIVAYSGFLLTDIDYKKRYIFSALFRRESSSLFGPEERNANYYRLSAAYRLTETTKIKGFQELKLRASIGTSGIRPAFEQRFETVALINGNTTKRTLGNNFLKPALSTETEIGIDATFLKAFDLEFNYAHILTKDQILLVPLPAAAGFLGQWRNAGTIDATVYEALLNTDLKKLFKIRGNKFKWEVATTFNRVQQKISELDVPAYNTGPGFQQSSLFLIEEGGSLGTMVGEVFATSVEQLGDQEGVSPLDYSLNDAGYLVHNDLIGTANEVPYKLKDASGNPLVQKIGDINPDFRMGFLHTISYGGLELFTLFDWKKGGDVYNLTKQWLFRDLRHAEVGEHENIAANFYGSDGLYNSLVPNNHFVEKGTFFMLREASLSYTINKASLQKMFKGQIESIRLSLIGRNLFTITKYSGFHPDVTSPARDEYTLTNRAPDARGSDIRTPNGDPALFLVDAFNYPLRKTYSFSLQVVF